MMRKLGMEELHRISEEEARSSPKIPVMLVLDNVRSALNVGSAFRTSDAFAVEGIILCGISAQPPHREILKTALGATETVKWKYFAECTEAMEYLQEQGWEVWAVEQAEGSIQLQHFQIPKNQPIALVFGNEVMGVSEEVMARVRGAIEIPQFGAKHSLNIAVSIGVVLWELTRRRL
jgi:23S rRNA (guanosine2251-2'-O)-methyltransferase